jgi:hypothetical protein
MQNLWLRLTTHSGAIILFGSARLLPLPSQADDIEGIKVLMDGF